jgi:hypothetical protein
MPYSLTINPPERSKAVWEGGDSSDPGSSTPQRRVSISTAGELNFRPTHFLCDEEVVQRDVATTSKVSLTSSTVTSSRVERLVREQQLRRNGRCNPLGDESEGRIEGPGGNVEEWAVEAGIDEVVVLLSLGSSVTIIRALGCGWTALKALAT